MGRKSAKYRRKSKKVEDRISELPDAIILHIFSFLGTKEAVRSGVLSKRFTYLWTNVPCLDFYNLSLKDIFNTLLFHNMHNLERISFNFGKKGGEEMEFEFGRLIRLLALHNVVKDLTIWSLPYFMLPQHLYSMTSLEHLRLESCKIETRGFVNWKSLQSLYLYGLNLSNNIISDIISGSPSLEVLNFHHCHGFTLVDLINNKCLRKLSIRGCYEVAMLKIVAPNLQSLVFCGYMERSNCRVLNARCLIDCCLDFYPPRLSTIDDIIMVMTSLFDDVSHAEVITIGDCVLQMLSIIKLNGLPLPMFKSVRCLKLHSRAMHGERAGIVWLLRGLNCLEKLLIDIRHWSPFEFPRNYLVELENGSFWESEDMKSGFDLKLRNVEICELIVNDLFGNPDELLLLVEFLLKNARFLESMTISVTGSSDDIQKLTKRVLSAPRSSPQAVIKILDVY